MSEIIVTLPDKSKKKFKSKVSVLDIASSIGEGLARAAIAGEINGKPVDLDTQITADSDLKILTFKDEKGKQIFWHSTAHLLAQAVKELFPDAVLAIGPAIENGFYYDFDVKKPFSLEDFEKIEAKMNELAKQDLKITRETKSKKEAIDLFEKQGNRYKKEILEQNIKGDSASFYTQGNFSDMCIGPHLPGTGKIQAVKLLKVAGAYWKGNEKNKMLQRIYGISFPDKKQLKEFIGLQEEAQKRDHRKIGKALDLFSFHPASAGCVYWHPKGFIIFNELENFWRQEHIKRGYTEIQTPQIFNKSLWEQSGHWEHYKDEMFTFKVDDEVYSLKPMDCPDSIVVYQTKKRSYRELPLRFNEIGRIFRNELSGTLGGLFRVRQITQDDAHIFAMPDQIQKEISRIIEFVKSFYAIFDFNPEIYLSTRPDKAMGSKEMWDKAESDLKKALEANNMEYGLKEKDGAFYGPKIDIHMRDCLNRDWQLATIQLDFQLPNRFKIRYVGSDGKEHEPVMIHRVIFGSFERFIGILIEEFAGAFPLWLAPVQTTVIPIADRHNKYAEKIAGTLRENGVRVEIDSRQEKVEYKIREAQLQKVPYVLVLGDREEQNNTITVRDRSGKVEQKVNVNEFLSKTLKEIAEKTIKS